MRTLRDLGLAFLVSCLAGGLACSSGSGSSTPNGGTTDEDAGSTPGDADGSGPLDPSGDAGTDGSNGSDAGELEVRGGGVTITQSSIAAIYSWVSLASFSEGGTPKVQGGCTIETAGACTATTCDLTFVPEAGVGPGDKILNSAGDVTVSSDKLAAAIVMSPLASNAYTAANGAGQVFAPGDPVRFQASGATVPAFDESVPGPAAVTVTSALASFPRDADLPVTFTGGDTDSELLIIMTSQKSGEKDVTVHCTTPTSSGTFTVPSAILQKMERAGANGFTGVLSVTSKRDKTITVGDHTVVLTVTASSYSGFFTHTN